MPYPVAKRAMKAVVMVVNFIFSVSKISLFVCLVKFQLSRWMVKNVLNRGKIEVGLGKARDLIYTPEFITPWQSKGPKIA